MSSARRDLLQFLKHAAHVSHSLKSPLRPVYVLGNPSADLDSIISAILYSYFASSAPGEHTRQYIPVVNLADVRSGNELRRLRPEFATALCLATSPSGGNREQTTMLKESILTIADLKERFRAEGELMEQAKPAAGGEPLDVVMVDWNALPLMPSGNGKDDAGIRSGVYENLQLFILGCIDHHDDESFIPPRSDGSPRSAEPRCIQTGVGSCTSLVVRELRSRGIWIDAPKQTENNPPTKPTQADPLDAHSGLSADHEAQAAKLALAAILADTANMTAKDKVSDIDRAAVSFLEEKIQSSILGPEPTGANFQWDRQSFYEEIMRAKTNSVENLTMDEILGRDYKEWTETSQSNKPVKVGFCNVVKPLSWILRKASASTRTDAPSPSSSQRDLFELFFKQLSDFSRTQNLNVVVLMTVFTGPPASNDFNRELLVWDINDGYKSELEQFESIAVSELGLVPWHLEQESSSSSLPDSDNASTSIWRSGYRAVWTQTDVSKSRKQVAPLVRNVLAGKLSGS